MMKAMDIEGLTPTVKYKFEVSRISGGFRSKHPCSFLPILLSWPFVMPIKVNCGYLVANR
jgi:hypothetical protein